MPRQDRRHRLDRLERAGFDGTVLERALHRAAHGIPFCLLDARRDAPVGDDFDFAIDELHVDQDAAVPRGIPQAELAEPLPRALARGQAQVDSVQRAFDGEADLAAVQPLRGLHRLLDFRERRMREGPQREPMRRQQVLKRAAHHQLPLAPPPPELPPPPLKPPPPPPKPPPPPNPPPPNPPLLQPRPPLPLPPNSIASTKTMKPKPRAASERPVTSQAPMAHSPPTTPADAARPTSMLRMPLTNTPTKKDGTSRAVWKPRASGCVRTAGCGSCSPSARRTMRLTPARMPPYKSASLKPC